MRTSMQLSLTSIVFSFFVFSAESQPTLFIIQGGQGAIFCKSASEVWICIMWPTVEILCTASYNCFVFNK